MASQLNTASWLPTIHTIEPQLMEVEILRDRLDALNDNEKYIKENLAILLTEKLIESGAVLFTAVDDPKTNQRSYKARIYIAPKQQVITYISMQKPVEPK